MTEYEAAMLALREREVAAIEANRAFMAAEFPQSEAEIWRQYAIAARRSSPMVTAALARDFANDMLKHDQTRWPR